MTDMPDPPASSSPEEEPPSGPTGAAEVMRERATAARRQRDQSIAELRQSMDDEQILDEFGIDLGEIER